MDNLKTTGSAASSGWERRKKRVRVYPKRIAWKWLLVILAAAVLVSYLLVAFGGLLDGLEDNSYRPKDIERRYNELQKMKSAGVKEPLPARESQ